MINSILIMRGLEELYPEIRFIERLRNCIETYPDLNWGDAMSRGQITSKLWLLHQLQLHNRINLGRVAICGGWVGILSRLLLEHDTIHTTHIHSMDTDLAASTAAKELNSEFLLDDYFTSTLTNCYDVHYGDYDTVINTSCEHFDDFNKWFDKVPRGKIVILQSNDFTAIEDHVDCVSNEDELVDKAKLNTVIYKGALPCYGYTRFMVIGVK